LSLRAAECPPIYRSTDGGQPASLGAGRADSNKASSTVSSITHLVAQETTIREFLSFRLGDAEYGIDILKVQEIRGCDPVTGIANTPDFIKGVIDLRGIIVPIVDMRVKFRLERADYDDFTVVIILNVAQRVVGIVVDGVSDVITLGPAEIKPVPEFGAALDTRFMTGIGTAGERLIILIDIERLMTGSDMALIDETVASKQNTP
jgi:purine-binding chemotaxis protein CheW